MKRIIVFVACLLPGMYAVWLGGYIIGRDMERARHVAPSSAAVNVEAPPDPYCCEAVTIDSSTSDAVPAACAPDSIVSPMDIAKQPGFFTKNGNGEILIGFNIMCVPKGGAVLVLHMKDICPAPPPKKKAVKPRAKVTPLGIGGPTTGMDTYIVPVDGRSLKKKAVKPSADKYFLTLGIPEGYQLWCADYQNCMLEKKP